MTPEQRELHKLAEQHTQLTGTKKKQRQTFLRQHSFYSKLVPEPKGTEIEQTKTLIELASNQVSPEDIKKITDDFDEIYDHHLHKDDVYAFSSEEEATKFFQDQADLKRSFLVKQSGLDSFMFSDGQNNFFKGSQDEWQDFLIQVQDKAANESTFHSQSEPELTAKEGEVEEHETPMSYRI